VRLSDLFGWLGVGDVLLSLADAHEQAPGAIARRRTGRHAGGGEGVGRWAGDSESGAAAGKYLKAWAWRRKSELLQRTAVDGRRASSAKP